MRKIMGTAAAAALLAACGGGGGGSSGNGSTQGGKFGLIHLLDHYPADDSVQIPVDATLSFEFDTPVALDSLGDEDTWLRQEGSATTITGSYLLVDGGNTVRFKPATALALETDYVFQLSGLTCDNQGRLLDETITFAFRTLDETPPRLLAVDVQEGAPAHERTGTFTFTFSEAIDRASLDLTTLWLEDVYGFRYPGSRTTAGDTVVFDPYADLPGDRRFTLSLSADVTDRAGNRLGTLSATT
ncbi:MAG: Ig-like domain-containing protein, partial [Planctomycetes bacterium]|nr:Ig-like domain-containing protein [Planctomycetota bacterium]